MATRYFDVTVSGDASYVGERFWSGESINSLWYLFNYNSDNRATWGLDANGWLQYRSAFGTYAGRYNPDDINLGDTYFEVDLQPAGSGNYEVGFFMRYIDRFSFYYLTFNGGYVNWGTRNIRLYKVIGTQHIMVADAEHPVFNTSTVYKFRCELTDANVKIYLNNSLIINWTDTSGSPYRQGAFGPWVRGQEFAKWRGFQAKTNSPVTLSTVLKDNNVTNAFYDAASAKLISMQSVSQILQPILDAFLSNVNYESFTWKSFRLSSSEPRVHVIFDRTEGANVTSDPASKIYAYQQLPTSPPLAPTNLVGQALGLNSIKLTWEHADDSEDGFHIYDDQGNLIATVAEDVLEYTETGLAESTTYKRVVVAFNAAGESAASNMVTITTASTIPIKPTNFQGTPISDRSILWTWNDNAFNETAYELITWDELGNIIVLVNDLPKGTSSYLETGLSPSTTYVRGVRARNSAGHSEPSNPFEVTTMDELPAPPMNAPVNFYGIGVSDTTIYWFWKDINHDEEGFELYDQHDNLIATIPANTEQYIETGLYSLNVYQRKIRAFNRGGKGPFTPLATAITLSDGRDQTGKPLPPMDLRAEVLDTTSVRLTWVYEEDEHFPAVGFKIFFGDGAFAAAVPKDLREHTISTLLPNTTYHMYIVAYNDNGDSLRSNTVEFTTPHVIPNIPDPIDPSDLEDPFYGISYDHEKEGMPKISAFQSGVGDGLDLVVRNIQSPAPNLEVFRYEVYITGEYQETIEGVTYNRIWESARSVGQLQEVVAGAVLKFTDRIPSPLFDLMWQEINAKTPISNYKLILTSTNPNVEITLEREVTNFFPEDSTFIELPMQARIINETQTAWYPSIHSGYYYLNQQEWFLYVDDRVRPRDGDIDEMYVMKFPYIIKAFGARHYDAQDFHFVDTTRADFLQGEVGEGITLDKEYGSICLKDDAAEGVFTSRIFRFGRPVTDWYPIEVIYDGEAASGGARFEVEVGASDYLGNVETWYPQTVGEPINLPETADKIRYRIKLYEGYRKDTEVPDYYFDSFLLGQGTRTRTIVVGNAVMIDNIATSADGMYITAPIHLGKNVDSLGTLRVTLDIPGTSDVKFFTVTFDDPNHNYRTPTAESPWIPASFVYDPDTKDYTIGISSAIKEYLAIIIQLTRGIAPGPTFTITPSNFDPSRAKNLIVAGDSIRLSNLTQEGMYTSQPVYVGDAANLAFSVQIEPDNAEYVVQSVFGATAQDVMNASMIESSWRNGIPSAPLQGWMMYRIKLKPSLVDCTSIHFMKDTYADFSSHSGRTNMSINTDGSISVIDKSMKATYTSEEIPVGILDKVLSIVLNGNGDWKNVKFFIQYKINGVWTHEHSYEIKETYLNGEASAVLPSLLNVNGTTHIRYRIEIEPSVPAHYNYVSVNYNKFKDGINNNMDIYPITAHGNPNYYSGVNVHGHSMNEKERWPYPDQGTYETPWFEVTSAEVSRPDVWIGGLNFEVDWDLFIQQAPYVRVEIQLENQDGVQSQWFVMEPPVHHHIGGNYQPKGYMMDLTSFPNARKARIRVHIRTGTKQLYEVNGPVLINYGSDVMKFNLNMYYGGRGTTRIDRISVNTSKCTPVTPILKSMAVVSNAYVGPKVSNIHVNPVLYELTRVVPKILEVRLGGHIKEGVALETYAVPMVGELIMDQKEYPITDKIVEDIVYDYLASRGVEFNDNFAFTDYHLQIDPVYPVQLRTNPRGTERVFARATQRAGDVLYQNIRIYFDKDDQSVVLKPIPQHGSPICIKNAAGVQLRQVHFRDDLGHPTLTNMEEPLVEHQRYLFLQYTGIDPRTLEVYAPNGEGWAQVEDVQLIENRVVLPSYFPSGTKFRVLYKLKDSFYVHYNYAPLEDYCQIKVHTSFDPNNDATRYLDIKYEVNKETAYYLAKEVDLNPLRSKINSGFIYLTDTVYPPFTLDVQFNPNTLYKGSEDKVIINAIILDEFGNPVVGEKADFSCNVGSIQVLKRISDQNGMVTALYIAPKSTKLSKATINISVISRDVSKQISKTVEVFFVEPYSVNKIAILPEKNMVELGDVVQLKVKVMGANNEPLAGRNVQMYTDQGVLEPEIGTTDERGELQVQYTYQPSDRRNIVVLSQDTVVEPVAGLNFTAEFEFVNRRLETDSTDGYVLIEAETYDNNLQPIREQILLGVSGV
jgi:hypothetical protein